MPAVSIGGGGISTVVAILGLIFESYIKWRKEMRNYKCEKCSYIGKTTEVIPYINK